MSAKYKANVELLAVTSNSEKLIESCGRTCYESYDKITEDSHEKIIRHLMKSGHLSVLEHASITFRISDVSRSFTHQHVRHRIGVAYSQKSQRYVKENDFDYIVPDNISENNRAFAQYEACMEMIDTTYNKLVEFGIRKEDARFTLPNSCTTTLDVTFNFRALAHFFDLRGDIHAQWEIRRVAMVMLDIVKEHAPTVFESYENDWDKEVIRRVQND